MWLLNTSTLELELFEGDKFPKYAILSHRWEECEATFEDARSGYLDLELFPKVASCCKQAQSDGFLYVWIDTCCIDKRSSAELSEAINSMYSWYQRASVCYAYLSDVEPTQKDVTNSRWFTRGWTLQELLAPARVRFYDSSWTFRGTKADYAKKILARWRIPVAALTSFSPHQWSIAERMSWASYRETTRVEDCAYCLLGLFGINMPLLYGEGQRAFQRLQESLTAVSNDLSIFAYSNNPDPSFSMLAEFPSSFLGSYNVRRSPGLINTIPDHIGFDEKPYSFIQQNSQYVMLKEGLEAVLQLHHYIFNVYCFRLGSIRFLRTKGIGKKFELPRLDLYAFLEHEPISNRYRRVALDGCTCVAKAVNRVLRTRTVRCMIAREPLQDFSSVEFDRSQLSRILHRRELRGFAFIASGTISQGGTTQPSQAAISSKGLTTSNREEGDSCPFAYEGHCLGFWYDPKVSGLSTQPALILHFGYDFEEQPVILLSTPSDACGPTIRDSRILGRDHVCTPEGCVTGLKRSLPKFLLISVLKRIWPSKFEQTYINTKEWQVLAKARSMSPIVKTEIEGIGTFYQYTINAQDSESTQRKYHALFEFSRHINGIDMLHGKEKWTTLAPGATPTLNDRDQGHYKNLHRPPRTAVRRTAALLTLVLSAVLVLVSVSAIWLVNTALENLRDYPLTYLLIFLGIMAKIWAFPRELSLQFLEGKVIEVIWDLALY